MRTRPSIAITAAALACVFNSSSGRASDPRPVSCFMIADANGKDVGLVQSESMKLLRYGMGATSAK